MRKDAKKLLLHRETLHRLNLDTAALRGVAGGVTYTCGHPCTTACSGSCGSCPPECTARRICGQ